MIKKCQSAMLTCYKTAVHLIKSPPVTTQTTIQFNDFSVRLKPIFRTVIHIVNFALELSQSFQLQHNLYRYKLYTFSVQLHEMDNLRS